MKSNQPKPKPNVLLNPKWKQRTHDTLSHHISKYTASHYVNGFIGDSMMERWLSTGSDIWSKQYQANSANWGVGGDGVEHLLYRLTGTKGLDMSQSPAGDLLLGFLDNVKSMDTIHLMIGTNNIDKRDSAHIFEAILKIIGLIKEKLSGCSPRFIVYGILPRKDVKKERIDSLNKLLENYVSGCADPKLEYQYFGDRVSLDVDYDDHVHLNKHGYRKWSEFIGTH